MEIIKTYKTLKEANVARDHWLESHKFVWVFSPRANVWEVHIKPEGGEADIDSLEILCTPRQFNQICERIADIWGSDTYEDPALLIRATTDRIIALVERVQ